MKGPGPGENVKKKLKKTRRSRGGEDRGMKGKT